MKHALLALATLAATPAAHAAEIGEADRAAVVETVAEKMEALYVFPDIGAETARELRAALADGAYAGEDGAAFAEHLSADLQRWTGDGHLNVEFSEEALLGEDEAANEAFNAQEQDRYYGPYVNHGFDAVRRLPGNVGLLEFSAFPPPAIGGETIAAAMHFLTKTDALIIDLRRNGGGDGAAAQMLASYLFPAGETQKMSGFYSRPRDDTDKRSTLAYVPGPLYGADKPVYILTSGRTFSAAEGFAYDLQALGRATVIGEPSGGGAHPFEYERVHPHFVLWLVTGRSLNPITGDNWQGVGVQPDIAIPAAEALETAHALALEALGREADAP